MFTVGEFSKIAQVSKRLLRYYDQIGLFSPEKVDDWTGYRYYSAQQLPQLNRILALKELGLSLDQIRLTLRNDVPSDEIRGMFAMQKMQIEQQLQNELNRLRRIEARLRHIDDDGDMHDMDVVVKALPAQRYLSMRDVYQAPCDTLPIVSEMSRLLPTQLGEKAFGYMTIVLFDDSFEPENIDVEIGFPYLEYKDVTVTLSNGRRMQVRNLEAVETAVTATWLGFSENSYLSYGALGSWVEDNGYRFIGAPREVFIVVPIHGRENEAVVEIQFPVERTDAASRLLS